VRMSMEWKHTTTYTARRNPLLSVLKSALISVLGVMGMACAAQAADVPERIISADGSLTEIVYALGESERLVGVDTTSSYPPEARTKAQIGYKRAISAEGTLSLAPDVVIATEDSGPDKVIQQLKAAGVEFKVMSAAPELKAVQEKITNVAAVLGKPDAGEALWQQVEQAVKAATARSQQVTNPLRVMFVLSAGDRSPLIGGEKTGADTMIRLAGGTNAAHAFEGYKPMPVEAVVAARPDVILMMDRAGHNMAAEQLFAQPGFAATPAAKDQRLIRIDGLKLLGFGPRVGEAIAELTTALYGPLETAER